MDLWTFQRYKRPRLCVDAITHSPSSRLVSLELGPHIYHLAFDDADAAEQIAIELGTLSDCNSPLWTTLLGSSPGSSWFILGVFLDNHSLISETQDHAAECIESQQLRIQYDVDCTSSAALDSVPPDARPKVSDFAQAKHQQLTRILAAGTSFLRDADPFDAGVEPNFFLALLTVEFEYLRRSSPLTLSAVASLLRRLAGETIDQAAPEMADGVADASGLYDERDLEAHLWLVGRCLALSVSEGATRFPVAPIPTSSLCCGIEFMRRVELLTRATLALWGPTRYVRSFLELKDPASPLIAGPYIEQYHVTRRFVEIVAPLLSKRLAGGLRQMMFRYFSEEVGHEALESTTCEALGVSERALGMALPLPLHFAFVDSLTILAEIDPIASFAAVMVIEGVFGEPPKMSLRLASVLRANPSFRDMPQVHDELNETLNHNSIARDAFEQVSAVSEARQLAAIRRVLFLLELNHRAWDGISDFYGTQKKLCLQGRFGRPLSPQT